MQMIPYLSFRGECEAAFRFYERCLGGQVGEIFRYGGSAMADQVPADWADKVMHGSMTIGGQLLMGSDLTPHAYEEPSGFSLSLPIGSAADAERIFTSWPVTEKWWSPWRRRSGPSALARSSIPSGIPWSINCETQDG